MKYDKSIMDKVNTSSNIDWKYSEDSDSLTYGHNNSIKIQKIKINLINDLFNEEWATKPFKLPAYRQTIRFLYDDKIIKELIFIAVDNFKALVPITNVNTLNIKEIDYKYSLLLNNKILLDRYIGKLNLKIIK